MRSEGSPLGYPRAKEDGVEFRLPVLLADAGWRDTISLLPGCVVTEDPERFLSQLDAGTLALVACPEMTVHDEFFLWLRSIGIRRPATALLCLAPFEPGTARALAQVPLADVVWDFEGLGVLQSRIVEASPMRARQALETVLFTLGSTTGSNLVERRETSVTQASWLHRASDLLSLFPGGQSARRTAWRAAFGQLTPKLVADTILLLKALALVSHQRHKTVEIAYILGVHERTLDRVARRLTGNSFAVVTCRGQVEAGVRKVMDRFQPAICTGRSRPTPALGSAGSQAGTRRRT